MSREQQSSKPQLSKKSRRDSIISSRSINADDTAFIFMHVENIEQLKYGIKKNFVQIKNAGIQMKIENENFVIRLNNEMQNHFQTKIQLREKKTEHAILKSKVMQMKKDIKNITKTIKNEHTSFARKKKDTSKKKFDSFIFIDAIESNIKKGLSIMKNKLTNNMNGYLTDFHEIIYVRTRIEGKALKHITIKLRKKAKKSLITTEKIFDVLGQIYNDFNQRINVMKSFKRLKQINFFKEFIAFGTKFQRLTIDVEMNDIETLLKDLKNKMSYELQKIMTANVYELIDLYEFAKKCQYMNQILRDVKNRSKYNCTNDNETITLNEEIVLVNIKTITSAIETSSFCQITSVSTSKPVIASTTLFRAVNQQSFEPPQINVMKYYNCNKMNHIFRNCFDLSAAFSRNVVIKKITTKNTENEKSKKE